jgi:hypothetical protein
LSRKRLKLAETLGNVPSSAPCFTHWLTDFFNAHAANENIWRKSA